MTFWLANLVAYSVQLTVLAGVGGLLFAVLRLHAPAVALRFWQGILALSVLWPALQLIVPTGSPSLAPAVRAMTGIAVWSPLTTSEAGADGMLATVLLGAIAAGALFQLVRIGFGLMTLRSIRATSTPASALAPLARLLERELGVVADVRFTNRVTSPATFGARRPTVLVPHQITRLGPQVQRAVLCHELLHVRRRDWAASLAEELWCALLWFHPAARAVAAQLRLARETIVDQATIAHTADRRAYASALLEFSTAGQRMAGAATLIGNRGLERRIALIAEEVHMRGTAIALRLTAAAVALGAAIVVTTVVLPISATLQAQTTTVYKSGPGTGVTEPQVIEVVKPVYTPEAMQAGIQGTVWVTAVVWSNGEVRDVTVVRSLDQEHGLDNEAIKAMLQSKFKPGTKDGKPVAVEITVEFTFTLK